MTSFIYKGLTKIWKSEIPLSEFCPISRDCGELGIPNLAQMSLIKSYSILQNPRVTAFKRAFKKFTKMISKFIIKMH